MDHKIKIFLNLIIMFSVLHQTNSTRDNFDTYNKTINQFIKKYKIIANF